MIETIISAVQEAVKEVGTKLSDLLPDFAKNLEPETDNMEKANQPIKNEVDYTDKKEHDEETDANPPIDNKVDGMRREQEVLEDLEEQYPESEGYKVESEVYLRDKDGNIVKDEETGEARRIDYVVTKDGKVVDSVEVTSKTASKDEQLAKEERIREQGGNYIKDSDGNLIRIPEDVKTRVERRD